MWLARTALGLMTCGSNSSPPMPQKTSSHIKARPPETDAKLRARRFQRPRGDADDLGDFLGALSSINEILNLPDVLRREFRLSVVRWRMSCGLRGFDHMRVPVVALVAPHSPRVGRATP